MNFHLKTFHKPALLLLLAALVSACGGGGSSQSTSGTGNISYTPTGVATINWMPPVENTDGSTISSLNGYKIYYGETPSSLSHVIVIDNPGVTSYVIENLDNNSIYYFAITAIDSNNVESPYSNIVSKNIS